MKSFFLFAFLAFFITGNGQTTYTIDYTGESPGTGCNVFGVNKTIDNYIHQTTKGFPSFVANPDYYVNLPCKRNSPISQDGTDYQIIFPFKKDYKYQINAYYKGTITTPNSGELYPVLALTLNSTKKTQNTSTNCSGPQAIDQFDYLAKAASGSGFAWSASPIINTNALTQNYESLSIASIPWEGSATTGVQSIQVRKIQITEIAPAPVVTISNNNISFNTPYQYLEDIDIVGTTPVISSGSYTYEWIIDGGPITPHTNLLDAYYIKVLENNTLLPTATHTVQRKITGSTGVVSYSNALTLPKPSSNIQLSIVDLPGNQKVGADYVAGSNANFTLSNTTPGVKYVWYYYHRYASSQTAFVLGQSPDIGTSYSITVGNYSPGPNALPFYERLMIFGSDGSSGTYYFQIAH